MNIRDKYEEVSDDDYEILGAVDRDTLLQDATDFAKGFTFAPGQGKLPKSIFCDDDAEYLAFPRIFCGQRRKENKYEKCIIVMYVNMNYDQLINELQKMFQIYFSNLKKSS